MNLIKTRNIRRTGIIALFSLGLLALISCASGPTVEPPEFDADRAFALLERQCEMGPRNPESPGWRTFHALVRNFADSIGVKLTRQPFFYYDYMQDDSIPLVNWILHINPDTPKRILLGSHYDTRPRADYDPDPAKRHQPIPGANDGASSTAVLLHLAELMIKTPPAVGVDLVLFDAEDYGPPGKIDQYLIGSTYFARTNETDYEFGIVIDMIGDSDLVITREVFSDRHHPKLNDMIFETAARLELEQFQPGRQDEIIDDHIPLIGAGIPAVVLIDFDYDAWHTIADTPDKCSPESLDAVGRLLLEIVYDQ